MSFEHDESRDDAEQLMNLIRNSGRATRGQLIDSADTLLGALNGGQWDLMLLRPEAEGVSAHECLQQVKKLGSMQSILGMMPGMSGLELLKKLRETTPECEVIMLSGKGPIETAVLATSVPGLSILPVGRQAESPTELFASARMRGGAISDPQAAAGNVGTTVEVRNLFFNTPARRKFIKGAATEFGHVSEMVLRLALPHPAIAFKLLHNNRTSLDLPLQNLAQQTLSEGLARVEKMIRRKRSEGPLQGALALCAAEPVARFGGAGTDETAWSSAICLQPRP